MMTRELRLFEAIKAYYSFQQPAYRGHPIGAPGSSARNAQEAEIAAEEALLDCMAEFEGTAE
jgi:hypothetical protein